MQRLKKNLPTILLFVVFMIGVGLIAYPSFSDWWNSFHQSRAVASYMEAVTSMDTSQYDHILKSADKYNAELAKTGVVWTMDEEQEKKYLKELNVN